jgi:hypothetical protein
MPTHIEKSKIEGSWVHSHEEDKGDRLMFRISTYAFPPSRGRTAFTLKSGGEVVLGYPGPDDRQKMASGHWSLKGDLLEIKAPTFSGTFVIETLDNDVLVVRRTQKEGRDGN